jgi:dihydrofolate reductase
MRKIIVSEFVTLDGVMEDPGGAEGFKYGGWTFQFGSTEQQQFKVEELFQVDALLLGRRTYQGFAAAWPTMPGTGAGLDDYRISRRTHARNDVMRVREEKESL